MKHARFDSNKLAHNEEGEQGTKGKDLRPSHKTKTLNWVGK
jgi:hypothetical protein